MANDLVAKLGVDASGWDAGFSHARSTMSGFSSTISTAALAAGGAVVAALAVGTKGVLDFGASLESTRKLAAVFEATGGAAGLSTKEVADFASQMQQLTNFEDDATVASAAVLGAFTNIKGDQFTDTLKAAMDMSTIMGGDLKSNVELLGKALNNPAEGLAKLARSGVQVSDAEEKKIVALQKSGDLVGAQTATLEALQSRFGGAAEAVASPWQILTNNLGDVSEMIGSALLPGFNVLVGAANSMLQPILGLQESFSSFGITAAVVLENAGESAQLAGMQFARFAVGIGADIGHFFTAEMPVYLSWFRENWQQIFITGASNTLTLFENLGANIKSVWAAVLEFFSTGTFKVDWTPLTQGFVNTVSKLPDIPKRALTELEKGMDSQISEMNASLEANVQKSQEKFAAMYNPTGKGLPGPGKAGGLGGGEEKTQKLPELKAALEGSEAAASIMLRGLGGPGSSAKNAEKEQEKQDRREAVDYTREMAGYLKKLSEENIVLTPGDF